MRRFLLAIALVTTNAYADPSVMLLQLTVPPFISEMFRGDKIGEKSSVTVNAIGNGKTCEQALENAKQVAIEKAVGVWMYGERIVQQEQYNEKIVEYSGGLIKQYEVVRNDCTTIEIQAEVVPRTNKIKTSSAEVSQQTRDHLKSKIDNEKLRRLAIKEVNDRSKAISFEIKDIEFQTNKMIVVGEMSFQPKWKHDYFDLKKQSGNFVLDSFYKPIHVNVKGFNAGKEIFNTKYQLNYDKVEIYRISDNGIVTIYPNRTETIKLTFPVDSSRIMDVDKFMVSIL